MASVDQTLENLQSINGFIAGAVAHSDSGMAMGTLTSGDFDIGVAVATNTEVVQAKLHAIEALELDQPLEDILITLEEQYHLIRPLDQDPEVFIYLALDKEAANLAMARYKVEEVTGEIEL